MDSISLWLDVMRRLILADSTSLGLRANGEAHQPERAGRTEANRPEKPEMDSAREGAAELNGR